MNWDEVGAIGQVLGSVAVFDHAGVSGGPESDMRDEAVARSAQAGVARTRTFELCRLSATDESSRRAAKMSSRLGYKEPLVASQLMERRGSDCRGGLRLVLGPVRMVAVREHTLSHTSSNYRRESAPQFDAAFASYYGTQSVRSAVVRRR